MTPFAHVAAGYLMSQAVDLVNPSLNFNTPGIILTAIIGGNIPDLDVFFVKDIKKHRNTVTHAPIFWLMVVGGFLIASKVLGNDLILRYLIAFGLGVFSHFFTDWFAARGLDGGIRLFYPFSKKHYGLYPLKKHHIKFEGIKTLWQRDFIKYYTENSFLFVSELILTFTGLVIFLVRSLPLFLQIIK